GKKIATGGPNSGAALTFELFTKHLGLWGKFTPIYLGGGKAVDAVGDRQVAAFNWTVNIGHSTITQAAATYEIRLIDLGTPAEKSGLYKAYPYFSPCTIPAGAYKWIDEPVPSFQQSTTWTANKDVDAEVVYQMIKQMYAAENKEFLTNSIGKVFLEMTKENALAGITIPLHPGAERFWKEQGVAIPPEISAK
ncbi:MAG: TAXI family TRAP transporter solute-binding subunit, partial [Pseudomonadota bacterium]